MNKLEHFVPRRPSASRQAQTAPSWQSREHKSYGKRNAFQNLRKTERAPKPLKKERVPKYQKRWTSEHPKATQLAFMEFSVKLAHLSPSLVIKHRGQQQSEDVCENKPGIAKTHWILQAQRQQQKQSLKKKATEKNKTSICRRVSSDKVTNGPRCKFPVTHEIGRADHE